MTRIPDLLRWVLIGSWPLMGVAAWRAGRVVEIRELLPGRPAAPSPAGRLELPPTTGSRVLVQRDPFRVGRRPTVVPYGSEAAPVAASQGSNTTPAIGLRLTGVVLEPHRAAIVEGFPGIDTPRLLRVGERVAGIRLTAVGRAEARLEGLGRAWKLSLTSAPGTP